MLNITDGCHIEIHPHSADTTDYYNYKGWYLTNLLAPVDHRYVLLLSIIFFVSNLTLCFNLRYRFMYINVGSPGRCNDSQLYETSNLKKSLMESPILNEMQRSISNVNVPVLLIGDSAFRLSSTMMKPYPFCVGQSNVEQMFNYALSKCRRVVENAFGQLKARFRRIGKGIDNQIENAPLIIKACCVLHNFLKNHDDEVKSKWITEQQKKRRE